MQTKDEVSISLLREQEIPTPKEFRNASESLSTEQQRFAKAPQHAAGARALCTTYA